MANQIKIQLHQVAASTSEAVIRNHRVLIDRPAARGGADSGPMGGELFLASVGGCFMSNLLAAIKARDVEVSDIRMEVIGTLADGPARFTGIELCLTAQSASPELLERLAEISDRGCIMMNSLRDKFPIQIRIGSPV
jgi:putative redox protein